MDVHIVKTCDCHHSFLLSYTFSPPTVMGRPSYDISLRMEPLPVIEVGGIVRMRGEFTSYSVGDDDGYDILYMLEDSSQVSLCRTDLKELTIPELHLGFLCEGKPTHDRILQGMRKEGGLSMEGAPQGFAVDPRRPPVLVGDTVKVVYRLVGRWV